MNPKEAYRLAVANKMSRNEKLEKIILLPYDYRSDKFIKKEEDYEHDMFMYAIAYLRNFLSNRYPKIIIEQYKEKLESQLLKFFEPNNVLNYANYLKTKLPEQLHNRMIMQFLISDDYSIKIYLEKYSKPKLKKPKQGFFSKSDLVYNILLENPEKTNEEVVEILWTKGVKVAKSLVTKIRAKINN
jgi:hypothetical protein